MSAQKPIPQSLHNATDTDLPEGWCHASLGTVAELVSGAGFPLDRQGRQGLAYPFFKVGNLGNVESGQELKEAPDTVDSATAQELRARIIPPRSVLFAKIGMAIGLNRRRLNGVACCIDNNMMAAIPNKAALSRYLLRFLETLSFMELASATTVPSLRKSELVQVGVPLAPLAEQKRIVAKVEELLTQVNAARDRLAKVPKILKRFRQSVLAAACSGRLTEDWRTASVKYQPSGLLERVLTACEGRWNLVNEKRKAAPHPTRAEPAWKRKYGLQEGIDGEFPEPPLGWAWVPLGMLGNDPLHTVQTGPFGAQLHRNEFTETGVPVVAVGNLTGMGFTRDGLYFITPQKAKQLAKYDLQAGDVLFARSGATLGKVCVAPSFVRDWRMTGHILRARFDFEFLLPEYAVYALHGDPTVIAQVMGNIRGVTRPGFNTNLLEVVRLQLPPIDEQHEIVRRVEALFKLADAIEKRVEAATKRADKLTQAILAKAFRGELVPTEAELARRAGHTYEPASALLERIRRQIPRS